MNCWALVVMLVVLGMAGLRGHQVDSVEFEWKVDEDRWVLEGEMDIAYMLPETRGIPGGQPLSRKAVMAAPAEELARIRVATEKTLRGLMSLEFAGRELAWDVEFPDFEKVPFELPREDMDWALLSARIVMEARPEAGELVVEWMDAAGAELIVLFDGAEGGVVSVQPGGRLTLWKVEDAGNAVAVKRPLAGGWLWSGFRHVVPLGLDHLLFIVGLFLLAPRWRPLLGQSLTFTLAHSITLALAVFEVVTVNGRWVEVFIAFSIAFVGVENLFAKEAGKLRFGLVFVFGLVHGLGFASVLGEKLEQVPRDQLVVPLVGFNVGVELAQVSVLAVAFLLVWPLRKRVDEVRIAGSALVALAGLGWMAERLFF